MNPLVALAGVAAIGAVAARSFRLDGRRRNAATASLERALADAGYTSLGADLSWLPVGPFASEILRHEPVFRVVASDAQGVRRSGWAHCPEGKTAELVWEA
jgi:hypothetical protein